VDYREQSAIQSAIRDGSKCNYCTLEELAILKEYPRKHDVKKYIVNIMEKDNERSRCISVWTDTWNAFFSSEGWIPKAG
jgi:hypothetical protein